MLIGEFGGNRFTKIQRRHAILRSDWALNGLWMNLVKVIILYMYSYT